MPTRDGFDITSGLIERATYLALRLHRTQPPGSVVQRRLREDSLGALVTGDTEAVLQRQLPVGGRRQVFGLAEPVTQRAAGARRIALRVGKGIVVARSQHRMR